MTTLGAMMGSAEVVRPSMLAAVGDEKSTYPRNIISLKERKIEHHPVMQTVTDIDRDIVPNKGTLGSLKFTKQGESK